MIKSFINRFKSSRSFKDFYTDWLNTLKSTHLPLFNALFSFDHPNYSLLSTQVNLLTNHFNSYFAALDLAANDDVSQLLFPDWRNSLEKPFLWFGDFHPYIFTNLLRSFIQDDDSDDHSEDNVWKNAGVSLRHFVEQLECGLRLMVPVIVTRSRDSQAKLVLKLAVEWREKVFGIARMGRVIFGNYQADNLRLIRWSNTLIFSFMLIYFVFFPW
ncbi:unnamed protein product [Amaranthus hypochondriacus]